VASFLSRHVRLNRVFAGLATIATVLLLGTLIANELTAPNWEDLREGMNRAQAEAIMGEPVEVNEPNAFRIELSYPGDRNSMTTLVFENDRLEHLHVGGGKGDPLRYHYGRSLIERIWPRL
jgi:hypothetical protein